ncbi:MAG: DHHA1 domain-containing protein, partial [Candidatus Neomarinimicrobiota bacterium]
TATHLLHKALKMVLGEHVQQAGSLVAPDRLRFDFTHYEKVTPAQLAEIEVIVNRVIRENHEVKASIRAYDEARRGGAVAIFGEKYGDQVRILEVPGFSMELCGGTHVDRTGDIGFFKITSETALAAGVRRIEAVTGEHVQPYFDQRIQALEAELLKERDRNKELTRRLKAASRDRTHDQVGELVQQKQEVHGIPFVSAHVGEMVDMDQFKDLAVAVKHRLKSAVVVLATVMEAKPQVVVAVTEDLKDGYPAGELAKELGKEMKGGGGGTPILGTAGGKDSSKLKAAIQATPKVLAKFIKKSDEA